MPVDRRDEHDGSVFHLAEGLMRERRGHHPGSRRALGERAHVGPGGEELLRSARHDDRVDVLVGANVVDRARERAQERVVVAVGGRPVEHDDPDPALLLQSDRHGEPDNLIRRTKPRIDGGAAWRR